MNIQWFPGHMAKTRKILAESLKLVDVVVELLDARIPFSSKNPELDTILKQKPKLIVINKSDLADEKISLEWKEWYSKQGQTVIFIDSKTGKGIQEVNSKLRALMKDKIERQLEKGRINRPIRTMAVGIPNVGKSSFINKIAGKSCAVTGDRPGVTRGKQWIRLNEGIELLDTPGILWPKFEDEEVGLKLAYTGAVKDDVLDVIEVAIRLMEKLKDTYPERLMARFKLKNLDYENGAMLLEAAGRKRGCVISGGEIDYKRISDILLDEFRGGKIGRITLEMPSSHS